MKVYYWKEKENFGDLLTPLLVKRFCNLPSRWSKVNDSQLVMVGSILHHLPSNYEGVIAGCGSLYPKPLTFPKAKILAVRGPKTLQLLGIKSKNIVLGDPGLLADELILPQDKIYELGVVPHWSDASLSRDQRFTKYNPKIIDVSLDPIKVITEIARCKKVVSSSLHGVVLADAFGIPRRIELAPDMISNPYEGGIFKWEDYSASIGMKFVTGITQEPSRNAITERQHELFDIMQEIKRFFSKDA